MNPNVIPPILRSNTTCRVGRNCWSLETADAVAGALRAFHERAEAGTIQLGRFYRRQCGGADVVFTNSLCKVYLSGELVALLSPGFALKMAEMLEGK